MKLYRHCDQQQQLQQLTWFGFKFVEIYERSYVAKQTESDSTFDRTTVFITSKILRVVVIILGILVAMQTLGLSIAGILAFGGVGGIAIGFAARELIANYFGGLMLFMDRPFKVGETITSSDRDIEGTVQEIGWRQTIIVKFDTRTLYVPNSVFATIVVRNMTRQKNRRIFEYVGIRYDDADQLVAIVSDTKDMLSNHPGNRSGKFHHGELRPICRFLARYYDLLFHQDDRMG